MNFAISANLVDIPNRAVYFAELQVTEGRIQAIIPVGAQRDDEPYLLPGFVDAHVHIESSLLVPSEFARLAVVHGTVATVSDPHEIANVCGVAGVRYMVENGNKVPFKFNFGAPSCVPATVFETAGAAVSVAEVEALLEMPEIRYLSEMMNFPGVLFGDAEVVAKIAAAKRIGKPVDGHAPGLVGQKAQQYIDAGISTDHECFTAEEALDKLQRGMKIIIREGSAAKNFEALIGLLPEWYDRMMFCSDDKHPDSLLLGHINQLCARAVAKGMDLFKVLQVACINPVRHYNLQVGLLQPNDPADFIVVNDLLHFEVLATFINGQLVAEKGKSLIHSIASSVINNFSARMVEESELTASIDEQVQNTVPVIEALNGQLITNRLTVPFAEFVVEGHHLLPNPQKDLLKIVVVNRYHSAPPAVAFIKNFGIRQGALASSVAHDSHNIVAVGTCDRSLAKAINEVMHAQGGLSAVKVSETGDIIDLQVLPLPVAGLMSNADAYEVAEAYARIDHFARHSLHSVLASPFMTLSFMALLVIPHLKLSDKGLFDGDKFAFVD